MVWRGLGRRCAAALLAAIILFAPVLAEARAGGRWLLSAIQQV